MQTSDLVKGEYEQSLPCNRDIAIITAAINVTNEVSQKDIELHSAAKPQLAGFSQPAVTDMND